MLTIIILILLFLYLISVGPIGWTIVGLLVILFVGLGVMSSDEKKKNEAKIKANRSAIKAGKINGFTPTKEIYQEFSVYAVYIDEHSKRIMIAQLISNNKNIFQFNELVECSIIQDGATILSSGVGSAVLGGIIGGATGAIIGASSKNAKPVSLSMSVRIIINNIHNPLYEIPIITSSMQRTSDDYKKRTQFAQEIYATMVSIINKTNSYSKKSAWR